MSEFKYACPVCGQHIKCDSSQAGTTMECPTCFQKIIVPQAPATADPKFIITGTKVGERPVLAAPVEVVKPVTEKHSRVAAIAFVVVLGLAMAAAFVFRGKIFSSHGGQTNQVATARDGEQIPPPEPPKRALVAPPANDTNWMLDLSTAAIPESTAAGRIHGKNFISARTILEGGTLTMAMPAHGSTESGLSIYFSVPEGAGLAGQTVNITSDITNAVRVRLRWRDDQQQNKTRDFHTGYALQIRFGQIAGNRLPGRMYLCTPDVEKSYVAGTFSAEIRKPKSPAPKASPGTKPSAQTGARPGTVNTNWTLDLDEVVIPDTPAGGKVHGRLFTAERMVLNSDGLTIRTADYPPTAGVTVYLRPNPIESVYGKSLVFEPDTPGAPQVNLRWKNAQGQEADEVKSTGYALRIEFGNPVSNYIPGKIYLGTPDELKSYVSGNFNAEIVKPNPQ